NNSPGYVSAASGTASPSRGATATMSAWSIASRLVNGRSFAMRRVPAAAVPSMTQPVEVQWKPSGQHPKWQQIMPSGQQPPSQHSMAGAQQPAPTRPKQHVVLAGQAPFWPDRDDRQQRKPSAKLNDPQQVGKPRGVHVRTDPLPRQHLNPGRQ